MEGGGKKGRKEGRECRSTCIEYHGKWSDFFSLGENQGMYWWGMNEGSPLPAGGSSRGGSLCVFGYLNVFLMFVCERLWRGLGWALC